ncbi:MAG: tyrosine-protein phosphatase [Bacillota bacterium]
MIDIHAHILPNLDDGAKNFNESLIIAKKLSDQGMKKVIATPHYLKGDFIPKTKRVVNLVNKLNLKINNENIDLEILSGSEIYLTENIEKLLEKNKILTLNNTQYLLIELPMHFIPSYFDRVIYNLQIMGYKPIIAHPERYNPIIKNYKLLSEWIDKGAYIQINAGSLLGIYGSEIKKTAEKIINNRLTQFVASDTHCKEQKRGSLTEALNQLKKITSDKEKNIINKNSENLIKGREITVLKPPKNNKLFLSNIKNLLSF